jgi:hypothetical protein
MRARSRDKADRPTVRMPFLWYRGTRYAPATGPPEDPHSSAVWADAMSRRSQKNLRAPVGWPTEAGLLLLRAAAQFGAESVREQHGKVGEAAAGLALYAPLIVAQNRLEAVQAERLRLTPLTAPRSRVELWPAIAPFAFSLVARLRGFKVAPAPPTVIIAQGIIAEIERRRSWRTALAAARPPVQSGW